MNLKKPKPNCKTLFEQQSYQDALDYYLSSLTNPAVPVWDYVILTASNEAQAAAYRLQIEHRLKHGLIPAATKYAVIPDLNGQRVGSGGATLSAIRYVREHDMEDDGLDDSGRSCSAENPFEGRRILVIHSGGDSKRIPQYSACGKLFSPVPRLLPDGGSFKSCGRRSTLFDEFLIGMSTVVSRIADGMVVCSGDVLLLFNALQIDFYSRVHKTAGCGDYWELGAAALSIKESAVTGSSHGVYLRDDDGNVRDFLHKQSVETLCRKGAVDFRGNVDIDTGAVILNANIVNDLYKLVSTDEAYLSFVNDQARLSFYADFLYPMASSSTWEEYCRETPEGDFTPQLKACREKLWGVLHKYRMKLIRFSPASFIHFGTTASLLHLMTESDGGEGRCLSQYRFLGWLNVVNGNLDTDDYTVSNSYVSRGAMIGAGSYIEDSRIRHDTKVGSGCIISGTTLSGETVPDGTVLHSLKQNDGSFVCRMYGVLDNPKDSKLFGRDLREFGIDEPLWTARIYPVCDTIKEAVTATLKVISNLLETGMLSGSYSFTSLKDSFNNADVSAILPWQEKLYEQVTAETILERISCGVSADEVKAAYPALSAYTVRYLMERADKYSIENPDEFKLKTRVYGYLFKMTDDRKYLDLCFESVANATLKSCEDEIKYNESFRLVKDVTVNLPVRVNFGGGWTDTPPYCMENGGTVLNAAVKLKGRLPIEAAVRRMDRPVIALASTDIESYREFTDISELYDCKNPSDPFALHKAALLACGVIPYRTAGTCVEDICRRLGDGVPCGIYMNTRVINIPKGSGLGTSSILAGACVKALFEAFGVSYTDDEVFSRVLCMEQLMSTGGGWQDQAGGIVPGIKLVTSEPGLRQVIRCVKCSISDETIAQLNERFALIYTGQRRLARNLLRDVVLRYISNDRDSLEAHYNIRQLAVLMRFELEKGNVDGFAELLTRHWEESRRIDPGSSNTCIDMIFESIDDLIDGRMICGAGGGGFLQVVLKAGVTRQMLSDRLDEVFQDSGVEVWKCEF